MTKQIAKPTAADATERDAFVERVVASAEGTFRVFSIYLGQRLGYYDALRGGAVLTSVDLAKATKTDERYAREWLEQQTVSGVLRVDEATKAPRERRYRLPAGHEETLVDEASLNYIYPLVQQLVAVTRPLDRLVNAYRSGEGISFGDYGADMREGQAGMNRPIFMELLAKEWIPAMPDVHARLGSGGRVADLGCGVGWSSIAMALGYPAAQVDGIDLDVPSIEEAAKNAKQYNVGDRARFFARDAADAELAGKYDLVTMFECVHDFSKPVEVLRTARGLTNKGGAVLVVDERVGDAFSSEGEGLEWMMYGWSVLHCLPAGKSEKPSAETGTVMRTDTLRAYAREAGFSTVEVLPVNHAFFRLYRLQ